MWKSVGKRWIVTIIVLIVSLSIFSGVLLSFIIRTSGKKKDYNEQIVLAKDDYDKNNMKNKIGETVDTSTADAIVSPNAQVIITETFKKCGHTITTKEAAPREIINLSKEKVQEYYKDCNIESFSANEIKISKENSGICPEHYILRESDGYISISAKNDIGEYIFKGLTDISTQYLSEDDKARLEKGIEVIGRENLNKFLEDYE